MTPASQVWRRATARSSARDILSSDPGILASSG